MYKYLILATVSILAACQPESEAPAVEEPADPPGATGVVDSRLLARLLEHLPHPNDHGDNHCQVQDQEDGEIFWKISEGRGMMVSWKACPMCSAPVTFGGGTTMQ